jgi:hypothetical protein
MNAEERRTVAYHEGTSAIVASLLRAREVPGARGTHQGTTAPGHGPCLPYHVHPPVTSSRAARLRAKRR